MDTSVIYCSSCGAANVAGARFCTKCGSPIQTVETPELVKSSSDFITLSCPNCGGKLAITPDMERFACRYCGMEHLVNRVGGAVSLAPVVEGLKRVETKFDQVLTGSDRLAAEQTIQRLKVEIPELERQVTAKEAQLKAIIPRESLHWVANGLTTVGSVVIAFLIVIFIFSTAGLFEEFPAIERLLHINILTQKWAIIILVGLVCILVGTILERASRLRRTVRVNPKHMNVYEKRLQEGNDELTRLKAELEERKQQLEQLHRYTAER